MWDSMWNLACVKILVTLCRGHTDRWQTEGTTVFYVKKVNTLHYIASEWEGSQLTGYNAVCWFRIWVERHCLIRIRSTHWHWTEEKRYSFWMHHKLFFKCILKECYITDNWMFKIENEFTLSQMFPEQIHFWLQSRGTQRPQGHRQFSLSQWVGHPTWAVPSWKCQIMGISNRDLTWDARLTHYSVSKGFGQVMRKIAMTPLNLHLSLFELGFPVL